MANPTSNILFKAATFFKNPENVAKFVATAAAAYSFVKTYFQSRQEPADTTPPLEEARVITLTQAIEEIEEENLRTVYFGPQPFMFIRSDLNHIPHFALDDAKEASIREIQSRLQIAPNGPQPTILQQLRDKSFETEN